jgi:hypothetical protein
MAILRTQGNHFGVLASKEYLGKGRGASVPYLACLEVRE